jgi:hypothetical protein
MKKNPSVRRSRAQRESPERARPNWEQALRGCEAAASRVKAAADELAACWTGLREEVSGERSPTDLLRKRAWCNILELRLKEQTHLLEEARRCMDEVWDDLMLTARARELFHRFVRKSTAEALAATESVPILAKTASILAAAHRRPASMKK